MAKSVKAVKGDTKTDRWPKTKCAICKKDSLPNDFRCQKCSDDYFREMIPIWRELGYRK